MPSQEQRQVIILVIQTLTKYFWTAWQIDVVSKPMFRVLNVKLLLKQYVNIFEQMEISQTIYEGIV